MRKKKITTKEVIKQGDRLNTIYQEYKDSSESKRKQKWRVFYEEWQNYRQLVSAYINQNPKDISDSL